MSDLVRRYRSGEITPLEEVERSLAAAVRSRAVFTSIMTDRARAEAQASALRWQRGQPLSELDGVPIAWKDLIDIQGVPTTAGRSGTSAPADADAALVRQAQQAGLVSIGKTNLSELAYSGLGLNPHHGTPVHPDFPEHVPGGSSSGAAIALACGAVPLSVGTDTGGSIRIPAAFNGLVGFRPTIGRYAMRGVHPLAPTFDTVGPLAHSVPDIQAFDQVFSSTRDADGPEPILVYDPDFLAEMELQPEVREGFARTLEALRARNLHVEARPLHAWREAARVIADEGWPGALEAYRTHRKLLASAEAAALDPRVRTRLLRAQDKTAADLERILARRAALIARQAAELPGVMLSPAVAITAPRLDDVQSDDAFARVNLETLRLTMLGSLLDQPGVSIPAGRTPGGQHLGLLLSAARGRDALALRAAGTVERALAPSPTPVSTGP